MSKRDSQMLVTVSVIGHDSRELVSANDLVARRQTTVTVMLPAHSAILLVRAAYGAVLAAIGVEDYSMPTTHIVDLTNIDPRC